MKIVGIDPSLASTGLCRILDGEVQHERLVKSKKLGDSSVQEVERLMKISDEVAEYCLTADLVAMEGMAFMAFGRTTSVLQLAALNYMIRARLVQESIPFIIVAPGSLKKFITGSGNAKKDVMLLSTFQRYGRAYTDDNAADAYGLALIAYMLKADMAGANDQQREVLTLLKKQL